MKKKLSYILLLLSLLCMNVMPVLAAEDDYSGSGINWAVVIFVPLIIAGIVCFILYSNMKSVHTASSAKQYEKEGSFNVSVSKDTYTHTTTQVIHHQSDNPSGGKK